MAIEPLDPGFMELCYVILYPFSQSNPSRYYRVAWSADWIKYNMNDGTSALPIYAQRDDFVAAQDACDKLNYEYRAGRKSAT